MNATSWRCGARAEIVPIQRGLIRARPGERALKQLWKMLFAAVNIPSNIVWIVLLKLHRSNHVFIEDGVSKAWGKTLNLVNQALGSVPCKPVG